MSPVEKFWYSKLYSGDLGTGWDTEIVVQEFYSDFVKVCNDQGIRHRPSDSVFGTQIKALVPGLKPVKGKASLHGGKRPNVYRFPSLDDCRAVFAKKFNYNIEWPVYEDTEPVTSTTNPSDETE